MDPLTMMALGSTALTGVGKLLGGFIGSTLDRMQASTAEFNANFLMTQAGMQAATGKLSLAEGGLQQSRTANAIASTEGAEVSKFTRSNLDPTYGSPLLLQGYSAGQGATDLALIGAKAELGNAEALQTAAGTMARAAGAEGERAAYDEKSTMDILSGIFGAATTALSGVSQNWAQLTQASNAIGSGNAAEILAFDQAIRVGGGP